jgi:putative oxidoreductase
MKSTEFIKLRFIPSSPDFGLLVLRLWLGLSMLFIHGLGKFQNFKGTLAMFRDKMGIPEPLGVCAILAESGCSILLVLGLAVRPAAFFLAVTMGVAFVRVHKMVLMAAPGAATGELPFIYLGGFVVLFLAGAGRFSVDDRL